MSRVVLREATPGGDLVLVDDRHAALDTLRAQDREAEALLLDRRPRPRG